MKKCFAVLMTVVLVMALSVTAFAASSPSGVSHYTVYTINGNGAKTEIDKVPVNESITVEADPAKGTFNEWIIYKADGSLAEAANPKARAATGDYIITEGSLKSKTLTVIPLANIIITGNYNNVKTEFTVNNGEPTSPKTGDNTVVYLVAVMAVAMAGALVSKKQLAK